MDYKEQIEQLEKLKVANKENYDAIRKKIFLVKRSLEQQINNPKIEVGKVYTPLNKYEGKALVMVIGFSTHNNSIDGYGFNYEGVFVNHQWNGDLETKRREATPEEWILALTKYCDELYKDCDRVDRTGLGYVDGIESKVCKFNEKGDTRMSHIYGFMYKGRYVMNKTGNFAKGLKAEPKEMFANIYDNSVERYLGSEVYTSLQKAKDESTPVNVKYIGTYKLVRVDK